MANYASRIDEDSAPSSPNWSLANWQISLGYVWFFAGIAAFTPFAAIYYKHLGFNGPQIGILAAMPAIGLILTGAFWGAVADKYAAHRSILRVSLLMGALFAFLASRVETFPPLLVLITALSFSIVPLRSLLDHYAVLVGEHIGRHFGAIRLWGAFGYTTFALSLGRMMNKNISSLFLVAYAISLVLVFVSTFFLPKMAAREPEPLMNGVREILRHKSFVLLLFVAWAQAVAASLIVVSLGPHIKGLGGTNEQVGAAFAVAAVSELPVFIAGAWLMKRLGASKMIALIIALYMIRMALLYVVDVPQGVIALQAMHGVTFGAFLAAGVPTAHRFSGGRYPATVQAILTLMSFGFGNITGSFLGGAMLDVMSTSEVFGLVSVMMAVTLAIFVLGTMWLQRSETPAM